MLSAPHVPAPHIIAINGIRTPTDEDSWPKRLIPWLESRYAATGEARLYRTGIVAPWNLWAVNPRIARVLASSIDARMEEIGIHPLHIVAHSNGTNIAVSLAKSLANRGLITETMVLIGSALHSDLERNGLGALMSEGWVRRAVAYCSEADGVVRRLQDFPGFYGSLGSRGFTRGDRAAGLRVDGYQPLGSEWGTERWRCVARWFPGYGHSDYFAPERRAETFRCIARDLRLGRRKCEGEK